MATMKLVYTTSAKLDALPIADGQIIFAPDDNIICLDMKNRRFTYRDIRIFDDEQSRLDFTNPIDKSFYYVLETNVM